MSQTQLNNLLIILWDLCKTSSFGPTHQRNRRFLSQEYSYDLRPYELVALEFWAATSASPAVALVLEIHLINVFLRLKFSCSSIWPQITRFAEVSRQINKYFVFVDHLIVTFIIPLVSRWSKGGAGLKAQPPLFTIYAVGTSGKWVNASFTFSSGYS